MFNFKVAQLLHGLVVSRQEKRTATITAKTASARATATAATPPEMRTERRMLQMELRGLCARRVKLEMRMKTALRVKTSASPPIEVRESLDSEKMLLT